jgi:hypothetical protein
MKSYTILFVFFALLFSGTVKAEKFDATIIDLEGTAIRCQIKAGIRLFNSKGEIDEKSIYRSVKVIMPDGTTTKYGAGEIQRFILHSTANGMRVFESHLIRGEKPVFLEVVSKKGVPLYRHYYLNHRFELEMRYALEDPFGDIVLLKAIKWRKHLTEIYPYVPYFEMEVKERKVRFRNLEAFLAGYEGATTK